MRVGPSVLADVEVISRKGAKKEDSQKYSKFWNPQKVVYCIIIYYIIHNYWSSVDITSTGANAKEQILPWMIHLGEGRTQVKNESAEAQAMEADAPMH